MVAREQRVIFLDAWFQVIEELLAAANPALGKIVVNAAHGDVTVSQARPAYFLKEIENHLPFPKGIEEGAECAQVQAIGAHADKVAGDAVEFGDDDANN